MPQTNNATLAAYYRHGIEAGIVLPQQAKDWAFSIVESLDSPPPDIIEVAMSGSQAELLEKLKAVEGDSDAKLAGRWLLYVLNRSLASDPSKFRKIVQQAMQIARATDLGDEEYYAFDAIDDSLYLAENETYGSIASCHADLVNALAKYSKEAGTSLY